MLHPSWDAVVGIQPILHDQVFNPNAPTTRLLKQVKPAIAGHGNRLRVSTGERIRRSWLSLLPFVEPEGLDQAH